MNSKNHLKMIRLKLLIFILGSFLCVNCIKEENEAIIINLRNLYEDYTGKKGTLVVVAESDKTFDIKDTSKQTIFRIPITNEKSDSYIVGCGFWKAELENLFIFCNIREEIPAGNYSLNFSQAYNINLEIILSI